MTDKTPGVVADLFRSSLRPLGLGETVLRKLTRLT